MIALQVTEPAGTAQLVNLLQVLISVAILVAVAIVAVSLITSPRAVRGSEITESPGTQAPEEEAGTRPASTTVSRYEAEVLRYLSRFEAVDLQDLLSQLPDSREYLAAAISRLAESGLVEVSSGVVILTEKGRKSLELLREKQWLKDLEQVQE